jgi:hypothetical protein
MKRLAFLVALAVITLLANVAWALPQGHILRIDPRVGTTGGTPVLTTIVDLVQNNAVTDATAGCNSSSGTNGYIDCMSAAFESDKLWSPIGTASGGFPKQAMLTVSVGLGTKLARLEGEPVKWGASKEPLVGTAWVIALDASSGMGSRFQDAREVAHKFIEAMGPNDLMDIVIFDDRDGAWVVDSKWKQYKDRRDLVEQVLEKFPNPSASHGSQRPLLSQLKRIVGTTFGSLGNAGTVPAAVIPMHQAFVVLSNGSAPGDPNSAAPGGQLFHDFATKGRFPEENTASPKTPLPIISIWFPNPSGLSNDLSRTNDYGFMEGLANTEIGGYFDIVRATQGAAKSDAIVKSVKKRFNAMWVVKWRLACLNLSPSQTFDLEFGGMAGGDASFKEVPIGVDPTQWPLDIDATRTKAEADANPLHPGGTFQIFGDFCWGGDKGRAEAYFVPAGTKPDPAMNNPDPSQVKNAMASLVQQGMRGEAVDVNDVSATFKVPDEDKILDGTGDNAVARVIVYDNGAARASGHDEQTVLTLKAAKKPMNWLLIAAIAGGVVVVGLLLIVLMRGGGGGGGRKRTAPPHAPVVAGGPPPYGGAPGGYGGPPPGGGYGGPPAGGGYGPPPGGGYGGPPPGGGGYGAAPQGGAAIPPDPPPAPQ